MVVSGPPRHWHECFVDDADTLNSPHSLLLLVSNVSSLQSAKVVLSELHDVSEAQVIRRTAPLALLFVVLAQLLGLAWTLGGLWPDIA